MNSCSARRLARAAPAEGNRPGTGQALAPGVPTVPLPVGDCAPVPHDPPVACERIAVAVR